MTARSLRLKQNMRAHEASLAQAEWNLSQKRQSAPAMRPRLRSYLSTRRLGGRRQGPVVELLPPENVKVRAFVGEGRIGSVAVGDSMRVSILVDGVGTSSVRQGHVTYISAACRAHTRR